MRYPAGTPYKGPFHNYDDQITPQQLIHRLVYGRPEPLLKENERADTAFWGRLYDQLANAHAAFVKVCGSRQVALNFASRMRKQLHSDLYSVAVRQDPDVPLADEWMVLVYNNMTRTVDPPSWDSSLNLTDTWIDILDAARALRMAEAHVARLMRQFEMRRRRDEDGHLQVHRDDVMKLLQRDGVQRTLPSQPRTHVRQVYDDV